MSPPARSFLAFRTATALEISLHIDPLQFRRHKCLLFEPVLFYHLSTTALISSTRYTIQGIFFNLSTDRASAVFLGCRRWTLFVYGLVVSDFCLRSGEEISRGHAWNEKLDRFLSDVEANEGGN